MSRGVGTSHSPSQIVEKLRDGDAMWNGGKTVSKVVQAGSDCFVLRDSHAVPLLAVLGKQWNSGPELSSRLIAVVCCWRCLSQCGQGVVSPGFVNRLRQSTQLEWVEPGPRQL